MTEILEIKPVAVKRNELQDVVNAALNHVISSKLVGLYSESGSKLERAVTNLPCLYCGERGLKHNIHCDRSFWYPEQQWERIIDGLIAEVE